MGNLSSQRSGIATVLAAAALVVASANCSSAPIPTADGHIDAGEHLTVSPPTQAPPPDVGTAAATTASPRSPPDSSASRCDTGAISRSASTVSVPPDAHIETLLDGRTLIVIDDDFVAICGADGSYRSLTWCDHAAPGPGWSSVVDFFAQVHLALTTNDNEAIAELVEYPLRVNRSGGATETINDRSALLDRFDEVFTSSLVAKVLKADLREAFCRHGYDSTIARGTLWASPDGIYVVNSPDS